MHLSSHPYIPIEFQINLTRGTEYIETDLLVLHWKKELCIVINKPDKTLSPLI